MLKYLIYDTEKQTISGLTQTIINYYVVVLLVSVFFVRSKSRPGIQRHGLFAVIDIIQFVLYAPTGIFTLLKRLAYAVLTQALYLGRMDCSALPRAWEARDPAYKAYLGFLAFELYYSNPIMLTAVYHFLLSAESESTRRSIALLDTAEQRPTSPASVNDDVPLISRRAGVDDTFATMSEPSWQYGAHRGNGRSHRARQRWYLAYTLVNNPSLVKDRRRPASRDWRTPPPPGGIVAQPALQPAARLQAQGWVDLTDAELGATSSTDSHQHAHHQHESAAWHAAEQQQPNAAGNPFVSAGAHADGSAAYNMKSAASVHGGAMHGWQPTAPVWAAGRSVSLDGNDTGSEYDYGRAARSSGQDPYMGQQQRQNPFAGGANHGQWQ